MEDAFARRCGDGEPDHGGGVDLHDLRSGVSVLPRAGILAGRRRKRCWRFRISVRCACFRAADSSCLRSARLSMGRMAAFRLWWMVTILLGAIFLADTGMEWYKLIVHDHLTIHTNLFGTTFLFAGGTACVARGGWTVDDAGGAGVRADGTLARGTCGAREGAGAVLALCGCRVGGGVYGGVRGGEMTESRSSMHSADQPGALRTHSIHCRRRRRGRF